MAAHSSILAWEIPWTEEPGGLQSMGLQRVGDALVTREQYSVVRMYRTWLTNASVDGHLGCLYFLALVNDIAVNTHVQVCAQVFISLGYTSRSGVPVFSCFHFCQPAIFSCCNPGT